MAALLALRPEPPDRTLRYGPHPSQVIGLYEPRPGGTGTPPGPPAGPWLVVLHGGFWREAYDRTHLTPFAAALAAAGRPVALVEYRRAGGGGGHPETFDDITAALSALAADPTAAGDRPPLLLGHSAGGQLALWAAATAGTPPGAVLAVAAVCDLGAAHRLRLGAGAVAGFLGDDLAGSPLLAALDPLRLPAPPCPVTLVHGTADGQVPLALSERYAAAHRATGSIRLHPLPATGHYAPVTPGTPAFRSLAALLPPVPPVPPVPPATPPPHRT
ncbi:alpha/beta hydrolase family protein [Streptomyces aidingensis]|nr:alpha/beta fold hydrolase [Streptomyces aidingensis]